MNSRQILRNQAIEYVSKFVKRSEPKSKPQAEKLTLVIMSKFKISRRTAREYIAVAMFELK